MSGVGVLGCEKCPNRKFIDGNCYQKCPDDYPVLASTGNCYKCDIAKTVIGIKILSGWEKCSSGEKVEKEEKIIEFVNTDNKQSNEIKTENVIPSKSQNQCPDDKPVLMFSGECAACDAVGKWDVVQSGCEKCNKKQDGHFCR